MRRALRRGHRTGDRPACHRFHEREPAAPRHDVRGLHPRPHRPRRPRRVPGRRGRIAAALRRSTQAPAGSDEPTCRPAIGGSPPADVAISTIWTSPPSAAGLPPGAGLRAVPGSGEANRRVEHDPGARRAPRPRGQGGRRAARFTRSRDARRRCGSLMSTGTATPGTRRVLPPVSSPIPTLRRLNTAPGADRQVLAAAVPAAALDLLAATRPGRNARRRPAAGRVTVRSNRAGHNAPGGPPGRNRGTANPRDPP